MLPSSDNNSSSSKNSGIIGQLSPFRHGREGVCGPLGKMVTSVTKGSEKGQMIARDQEMQRLTDNDSSGAAIRMCSNCNTTKTPLWRSGPRGPKVSIYMICTSFFNANRYRKQSCIVSYASPWGATSSITSHCGAWISFFTYKSVQELHKGTPRSEQNEKFHSCQPIQQR